MVRSGMDCRLDGKQKLEVNQRGLHDHESFRVGEADAEWEQQCYLSLRPSPDCRSKGAERRCRTKPDVLIKVADQCLKRGTVSKTRPWLKAGDLHESNW